MLTKRVLGVAALLVIASAVVAAAAPATVERSAKLRSGPGTGYRVIATLPRGATIDVNGCSSGWCEVAWDSRHGYVAQRLLASTVTPPTVAATPIPATEDHFDYPGFDYPGTAYAPAVGVTVVPRWSHRRWSDWRHRYGRQRWTVQPNRPPVGAVPGARSSDRPTLGRAGGLAPMAVPAAGGTTGGVRPTVGSTVPGSGPSAQVPAPPAISAMPSVSYPATAVPAAPASRDTR